MDNVLFAFELDLTIWNLKNDSLVLPVEKKNEGIEDANNNVLLLFPEVIKVFERIKRAEYEIAFTSRSTKPELAEDLVLLLGLNKFPTYRIFNNEAKNKQLAALSTRSGIPFKKIIYYDTLLENVQDVKPLGACTFLIPDEGLTLDTFIVSMKNASLSFALDLDRLGITWGQK